MADDTSSSSSRRRKIYDTLTRDNYELWFIMVESALISEKVFWTTKGEPTLVMPPQPEIRTLESEKYRFRQQGLFDATSGIASLSVSSESGDDAGKATPSSSKSSDKSNEPN